MSFLPYTKEEMDKAGWDSPDFVLVTGDAYIDHPSFGGAIISRVLASHGYKVAILSQPDYKDCRSFGIYGNPRLGYLVTAGNIDSMVAHYTVSKSRRREDNYTPGNKPGRRPDRAVTVYSRKIKELFPTAPVIIGGIEASLRRLAHYDYWSNKVLPSILLSSGADILVYGMGERQILEIAALLKRGRPVFTIHDVRGTVYSQAASKPIPADSVILDSFNEVSKNKRSYAAMAKVLFTNADHVSGQRLIQPHGDVNIIQNPPALPLTTEELDAVYALPYEYGYPTVYDAVGGVKALSEVRFSITHNRGCFGACNFCSLAIHQGRFVVSRSHESVLREAEKMTSLPGFKGYISDLGGATANFRKPACKKQEKHGFCRNKRCLFPQVCSSVQADHSDYLSLLGKLRQVKGIKKVFIRSGIRYDYLLADKKSKFLGNLVKYHVSGQLRVAPEHSSPAVLKYMGKPEIGVYEEFSQAFYRETKRIGKEQYVVPYLMSSHPGSTLNDAIDLAVWLRKHKIRPEQVQDFYPTPGTISTAMYYTGIDPFSGRELYVPRGSRDKLLQRCLLQSYQEKNRDIIIEALTKGGRKDLIPWLVGKERKTRTKRPARSGGVSGSGHDRSQTGKRGRKKRN